MSDILKQESVKFGFSLVFLALLMLSIAFILPKITERAGAKQAAAFWTEERKQNLRRLFGDEDAV